MSKISKALQSIPLFFISAFLYGLTTAPINNELHPLLFWVPLVSVLCLLPFIHKLIHTHSLKKRVFWLWGWGIVSTIGRTWWVSNVMIDGLLYLLPILLIMLGLFLGFWYMVIGNVGYYLAQKNKKLFWLSFPALWVVVDWIRTLGELSIPWYFEGYRFVSFLSFAQLASVTGVWGLTFVVIMIITLLYFALVEGKKWNYFLLGGGVFLLFVIALGAFSLLHCVKPNSTMKTAIIQSNMDQFEWKSGVSLDTSMDATEKLLTEAADSGAELAVLSESGVFCYLDRNSRRKRRFRRWADTNNLMLITGTLDYEYQEVDGKRSEKPDVYNAAFFLKPTEKEFEKYYKHRLVPFGEALPFEGIFPLLSRVDLGEGDFSAGTEETIWNIKEGVAGAPLICYESIYPNFVRRRVKNGANLLVNVTNDGWYGKTTGPYQHSAMSRMRAIENGVPMIRAANTGKSYIIDPYGRFLIQSKLYVRKTLVADIPLYSRDTLYSKLGDWFVLLSFLLIVTAFVIPTRKEDL